MEFGLFWDETVVICLQKLAPQLGTSLYDLASVLFSYTYHLHMCTYCLTIDITFYIKTSNTMIIIADFDEVRHDYSSRKNI